MFQSAITAFYRSLARHPLYAVLNLLGLSIGIAVFIVLGLFVRSETNYERWFSHAGAVYEVTTLHLDKGKDAMGRFSSAGVALDAIKQTFPDTAGTRVVTAYMILRKGGDAIDEEGQLVDRDAFRVFDVGWLAGDPATALRPGAIILSEAKARKYFGRSDVLGRSLTLRDDLGPMVGAAVVPPARSYVVTGILRDPPGNAKLRFDFVRLLTPDRMAADPYWRNWAVTNHRTYLYLPDAGVRQRIEADLDRLVDSVGEASYYDTMFKDDPRHCHLALRLVALTAEHLANPKAAGGVWILATVGLLAFNIALINYINLAVARSGLRAREVAVRKAMGATSGLIRLQFLGEAVLVSLTSGLLGFSLVELLLPVINLMGGLSLRLDYVHDAAVLGSLMGCVLVSGLVAGLYPAFVLAAFEPAQVLASARSPGGGRFSQIVRETLVVFQFTVVSAFFIVVTGFAVQLHHMTHSDLGFRRDGMLLTNSTISSFLSHDQAEAIRAQWRTLPNVVSVTSGTVPGRYFMFGAMAVSPPDRRMGEVTARTMMVERDFFRTYGTKLLAGRGLSEDDATPADRIPIGLYDHDEAIMINRAAVPIMGFSSPADAVGQALGHRLARLRIVGVVEDQRFAAPTEAIGPVLYFANNGTAGEASTVLRFEGVPEEVMRARMAAAWRTQAPDLPLVTESGEDILAVYYESDRRETTLFAVGAVVAGLIGAIGLYGMAAFSTSSRALEIGLRKVMGASRARVARLLVAQFMRPVVVANLIAWPVAGFTLARWLGQFDDRVALQPWFFVAGSGISVLVAVVTVAGLALSTAGAAPGKALRDM